MTKDEENTRFEAHRKYADIQYLISGQEKIGISPLEKSTVTIPYNEEKDICFLHSDVKNYRLANSEKFFIFFPDDAHRPGMKAGEKEWVKKIVIKVKVE